MKHCKILSLAVILLSSIGIGWSQSLTLATAPTDLPTELCGMPILGTSANGRYVYGHFAGKGFVLDTETEKYNLYGDEAIRCEVVGVSSDGWSLVQSAEAGSQSGLSDKVQLVPSTTTGGQKTIQITSPDPEHPFFSLWYMTSDAKYFCGTIINSGWETIPIIGERSADGAEYRVTILPVPDKDPLGTKPQQFRLIYVSEDGAMLVGFLVEQNGYVSTIMTYNYCCPIKVRIGTTRRLNR